MNYPVLTIQSRMQSNLCKLFSDLPMKNFKILSITTALFAILPLANSAQANPGLLDVGGNAALNSGPVSGILGSGTVPGVQNSASFAPEIQSKVNSIGSTLTASSISGSQSVGGNTVAVDPVVAQALLDLSASAPGSDTPALAAVVTALGGGDAAQALAGSMRGLIGNNGTINPVVLTTAAGNYSTYVSSLVTKANVTALPVSDLESVLQSMPAGQKAAQVLLTKLLASG
jgi:hypothetical protein